MKILTELLRAVLSGAMGCFFAIAFIAVFPDYKQFGLAVAGIVAAMFARWFVR